MSPAKIFAYVGIMRLLDIDIVPLTTLDTVNIAKPVIDSEKATKIRISDLYIVLANGVYNVNHENFNHFLMYLNWIFPFILSLKI